MTFRMDAPSLNGTTLTMEQLFVAYGQALQLDHSKSVLKNCNSSSYGRAVKLNGVDYYVQVSRQVRCATPTVAGPFGGYGPYYTLEIYKGGCRIAVLDQDWELQNLAPAEEGIYILSLISALIASSCKQPGTKIVFWEHGIDWAYRSGAYPVPVCQLLRSDTISSK